MRRERFALIAGGGTGGHVLAGLSVARALVRRGHPAATIELVGSRRGQESALLAGAGFPFVLLPGRGIVRRLRLRELVPNFVAASGLAAATVWCLVRLARRRPAVVVSVGGYASLPAAAAAVVLRVPLVLVNLDAVPGAVHRLLGRWAAASALAFESTALPRSQVTGAPLRPEITEVTRSVQRRRQARAALGLPEERRTIVVFGGSLGARRLNEAACVLAQRWADRRDLTLYHITGTRDFAEVTRRTRRWRVDHPNAADADGLCYRLVAFEDRMPLVYEAADVAVCRAGALTVAELAAVGLPAVLVPLPGAPGDHQSANAAVLARQGGAVVVPDGECDADRLEAVVGALVSDAGRLEAMAAAARAVGRPDAADRVAELVVAHAR